MNEKIVDQATEAYPNPDLNPYLVHLRALRDDVRDIKEDTTLAKKAIQFQNGRVREVEDAVHRIDTAIELLTERSLKVPEVEIAVRSLVREAERAADRQKVATAAATALMAARDRQLDRTVKLVGLVSGTGILSWLATTLWPIIGSHAAMVIHMLAAR